MKDTFYFPHDNDARNDDKILELRSCFWNEWYSLFFYTLETMSQSEDWGINRVAIGGLSLGYGVAKATLEQFYQKCIDLDLFFVENDKIFSHRMCIHKNARKALSDAWKSWAKKRWENRGAIAPPIARKGKERKAEENIETNTPITEWDIQFEKFWDLYWKKVDRKKTETAFLRLSQKDKDEIFLKLPVYIESRPDIQYRKNPLTWLHGRNWEDETISNPAQTSWLTLADL